jgi:hypothetical protein
MREHWEGEVCHSEHLPHLTLSALKGGEENFQLGEHITAPRRGGRR